MSKVVIFVRDSVDLTTMYEIHKFTGKSFLQIKRLRENDMPIFECEIFGENYKDFAGYLLEMTQKFGNDLKFYEVGGDFDISDHYDIEKYLINRETLENILSSADYYE